MTNEYDHILLTSIKKVITGRKIITLEKGIKVSDISHWNLVQMSIVFILLKDTKVLQN